MAHVTHIFRAYHGLRPYTRKSFVFVVLFFSLILVFSEFWLILASSQVKSIGNKLIPDGSFSCH